MSVARINLVEFNSERDADEISAKVVPTYYFTAAIVLKSSLVKVMPIG
mgnify:CR=1 FL=1